MTPNEIEVLIHCYVSPVKHPRFDNVIVVMRDLADEGLLVKKTDTIYSTTEKGVAHIAQLCALPYPKQQYIGYDGKVISNK